MSLPVILFGVGELADMAFDYIADGNGLWQPVAFTCDEQYIPNQRKHHGLPVIPFAERDIAAFWRNLGVGLDKPNLLIVISSQKLNSIRADKFHTAKLWNIDLITFAHHTASISKSAFIGENCFIGDLVAVQPRARIGSDTVIRSLAYIGHHTTVGSHSWISPGAKICSKVEIGEHCFIGAGAVIRDGISIGDHSFIAMGAIVTKDVPANSYCLPGVNIYRSPSNMAVATAHG